MDGDKYPKSFVEPIDMFVGCGRVTGKQEVIPNNLSGNRLLAPVVKKGFPAGAPSG
jgi:hypothetical protein